MTMTGETMQASVPEVQTAVGQIVRAAATQGAACPNPWPVYEDAKRKLRALNLCPAQYDQAIRCLVQAMDL